MDVLSSKLPTKVKVNNNIYDINYDYRTIINIIKAFEDNELTKQEKLYILIKNFYKEDILNEDLEEACKKAIKFIDIGKENNNDKAENEQRLYSFKKDAQYIFTGISQTHNIDLERDYNMHWWKFNAFFMDMKPNCMFGELIYYRKRKADGKLTKEEKENYKKLIDILEIDEYMVQENSERRKQFFEELHKND